MSIFEIRKASDTPSQELIDQLLRWPSAANHDRQGEEMGNYIFSKVHPSATNPIEVYKMNFDTEQDLLNFVAKEMLSENRDRPIHLVRSQLKSLFDSPIWKLWCCRQETKQELQEAYQKVFGQRLDLRKSHNALIEKVKNDIKGLFQ